jgi:hypothetical protein
MSWSEIFVRAGIAGTYAGVAAYLFFNEAGKSIYIVGANVPTVIVVSGSVAVGSVASDIAGAYLLPYIPGNAKYSTVEGTALALLASGAVSAFTLINLAGASGESLGQAMLVGAGSYVLADFTTENLLGYDSGSNADLFSF